MKRVSDTLSQIRELRRKRKEQAAAEAKQKKDEWEQLQVSAKEFEKHIEAVETLPARCKVSGNITKISELIRYRTVSSPYTALEIALTDDKGSILECLYCGRRTDTSTPEDRYAAHYNWTSEAGEHNWIGKEHAIDILLRWLESIVVLPEEGFDQRQANAEGWGIFNDGEIQRLDTGAVIDGEETNAVKFNSDEEAVRFVTEQQKAGSAYHAEALEIHYDHSLRDSTTIPNHNLSVYRVGVDWAAPNSVDRTFEIKHKNPPDA